MKIPTMVSKRDVWIVGLLGFLVVNLVVAFHFYDVGRRKALLKTTTNALAIKQKEAFVARRTRDSLMVVVKQLHNVSAQSQAAATKSDAAHEDAKKDVTLRGDTAITKDASQVLLPQVAARLRTAESALTDQKKANADLVKENTALRFLAFKADSTLLDKEESLVQLNKRIAELTRGSRLGYGLQLGGGYCIGKDGGTPCVALTFGPQVKLW